VIILKAELGWAVSGGFYDLDDKMMPRLSSKRGSSSQTTALRQPLPLLVFFLLKSHVKSHVKSSFDFYSTGGGADAEEEKNTEATGVERQL
jgi:hypothetical protein